MVGLCAGVRRGRTAGLGRLCPRQRSADRGPARRPHSAARHHAVSPRRRAAAPCRRRALRRGGHARGAAADRHLAQHAPRRRRRHRAHRAGARAGASDCRTAGPHVSCRVADLRRIAGARHSGRNRRHRPAQRPDCGPRGNRRPISQRARGRHCRALRWRRHLEPAPGRRPSRRDQGVSRRHRGVRAAAGSRSRQRDGGRAPPARGLDRPQRVGGEPRLRHHPVELRVSANGRPVEIRRVIPAADGAPIHEVFTCPRPRTSPRSTPWTSPAAAAIAWSRTTAAACWCRPRRQGARS